MKNRNTNTDRSEGTIVEASSAPVEDISSDAAPGMSTPAIASTDELMRVLQLRWRIVALTTAAVVLIAWTIAALQPKVYRASSIAAITATAEGLPPGEMYRGIEVLEQRTIVSTVAALAAVPETVRQAVGTTGRVRDYEISAIVLPNTNLLRIDVDGHDPARAAEIANRVPSVLAGQTRTMYKLYGVSTVSAAVVPTVAIGPRVGRAVAGGVILGIILGIGLAFSIETVRQRRRSEVRPGVQHAAGGGLGARSPAAQQAPQ